MIRHLVLEVRSRRAFRPEQRSLQLGATDDARAAMGSRRVARGAASVTADDPPSSSSLMPTRAPARARPPRRSVTPAPRLQRPRSYRREAVSAQQHTFETPRRFCDRRALLGAPPTAAGTRARSRGRLARAARRRTRRRARARVNARRRRRPWFFARARDAMLLAGVGLAWLLDAAAPRPRAARRSSVAATSPLWADGLRYLRWRAARAP